jgi:hypothetical protein
VIFVGEESPTTPLFPSFGDASHPHTRIKEMGVLGGRFFFPLPNIAFLIL